MLRHDWCCILLCINVCVVIFLDPKHTLMKEHQFNNNWFHFTSEGFEEIQHIHWQFSCFLLAAFVFKVSTASMILIFDFIQCFLLSFLMSDILILMFYVWFWCNICYTDSTEFHWLTLIKVCVPYQVVLQTPAKECFQWVIVDGWVWVGKCSWTFV